MRKKVYAKRATTHVRQSYAMNRFYAPKNADAVVNAKRNLVVLMENANY